MAENERLCNKLEHLEVIFVESKQRPDSEWNAGTVHHTPYTIHHTPYSIHHAPCTQNGMQVQYIPPLYTHYALTMHSEWNAGMMNEEKEKELTGEVKRLKSEKGQLQVKKKAIITILTTHSL
jgi:hypothetical protein